MLRSSWLKLVLVALALAFVVPVVSCGSDDGSNFPDGGGGGDGGPLDDGQPCPLCTPDASVDSLVFDPPSITLTLDGQTPKTASFTLKATIGSQVVAVAPESIQFDRPDLASSQIGNPVVLTAPGQHAGLGTLHGVYKGKQATAQLTVVVNVVEQAPNLDPAAITALKAPNLGKDPTVTSLLYPYDKTVFPLGITSPLVMWNAPSAADVYRVHFEQKNYTYDGFFSIALPAQWRLLQAMWDKLTASNQGDPLSIRLSRWDATAKVAYDSANEAWTVAHASLRGAIYYWTTSAGGHMARIQPGTGAQPAVLNNGKCMGCHAVSADGSTLVASVEGQVTNDGSNDNRAWVSFDLPNATVKITSTYFSGNLAVNPNGKYTVFGTQTLKIGNTATGQRILNTGLETLPLDSGMNGFMTPAFSPDGKRIAAVEGAGSWYHNLVNGKLVVADFDESTVTFSKLVGLAPASSFAPAQRAIAYPSFTPDSQLVAFHVADYATGCDVQGCDDNATQIGSLWLQNVNGSAPIKLTQLNDSSPKVADQNRSLEPTFNPIERGGYSWVVFTSMRDWGNRITGTPNNGKKRLWVAAIDKTVNQVDPSHPAFFLEGQEENTTNMRGFWALAACIPTKGGGACKAGFECCSGFCDNGKCIDGGDLTCKGVGEVCAEDADCCNVPFVRCTGGKCAVQGPN